jgi:hypothetical protein
MNFFKKINLLYKTIIFKKNLFIFQYLFKILFYFEKLILFFSFFFKLFFKLFL